MPRKKKTPVKSKPPVKRRITQKNKNKRDSNYSLKRLRNISKRIDRKYTHLVENEEWIDKNHNWLSNTSKKMPMKYKLKDLIEERQKQSIELLKKYEEMFDDNKTFKYIIERIPGDGNCFYRAIYRSAKNHPNKTVLERFFNALDIFYPDPENPPIYTTTDALMDHQYYS